MLLALDDPRLLTIPTKFESYWPDEDSLLNEKVAAMLASDFNKLRALRSECKAGWDLMRMTWRAKATVAGDFLKSQLKQAAWFKDLPGVGKLPQGIFASVNWDLIRDLRNPEQALTALTGVAVPAAITAVTAVPMAGQLAAAYFAAGLRLADMFSAPNPLVLPWSQYSRAADTDLVRDVLLGRYAPAVDQTGVFLPPFDPNAPWQLGAGGSKKNPHGYVWAPFVNGEIPWSKDNLGALPGTQRIFGQTQVTRGAAPVDGDGKPIGQLERWIRRPQGTTPREAPLPWPPTVTNVGDFFPSAATAAGVLWNQAQLAGAPDMFKMHTGALLQAWGRAFESIEESFIELWNNPAALMQQIWAPTFAEARLTLGAAMEPWVAVRLDGDARWTLGVPWRVPSAWSLVTPAIYTGGRPGDPSGRTPSMWIEEDAPRRSGSPLWPYGSRPRQHPCARWNKCSSDLAATVNFEKVISPAAWKDPNGPAPKGYRKQPWPPPEADAAEWASPYTAIVRPALQLLAQQQAASLQTTLVCAYVRPAPVGDLAAYGAFANDFALAKLCNDMRQVLLTHPLRYRVSLEDVDTIDPGFAAQLRASGVTGGPGDFAKSLSLAAGAPLINGATPPQPAEPPQGGIPWEKRLVAEARRGGGVAAVAAVAALGLLWGTR